MLMEVRAGSIEMGLFTRQCVPIVFEQLLFPEPWAHGHLPTRQHAVVQCNLGMLKIEMNFAGVQAGVRASINGVSYDTTGCVPLKVDFTDTLKKGKRYYWDFGDGSGDTTTFLPILISIIYRHFQCKAYCS